MSYLNFFGKYHKASCPVKEKTTLLLLLFIIALNPKFHAKAYIVSLITKLKASLKSLSLSS